MLNKHWKKRLMLVSSSSATRMCWRSHLISVPMHFNAPSLAGQNALLATAHIVDVLDLLRTHMTSDWRAS
jgi:hypothetical protein